jgi:hypothetical protein
MFSNTMSREFEMIMRG